MRLLKQKSLSLHWEFMYARLTDDMIEQHKPLQRVAGLIDSGVLKTTLGEHFGRDRRRQPAPRPCTAGKQHGEGQDRARRVLTRRFPVGRMLRCVSEVDL